MKGGLRGQGNFQTTCPECGETTRVDEFTKDHGANPVNIPVQRFDAVHIFTNDYGNICVHYVEEDDEGSGGGLE